MKAPFTAGEDDVCALPAGEPREVSSCVTKGEGRGNGGRLATTTSVGGAMGGVTPWPVLVARPASPRRILHPRISRPRCSIFPAFTHRDVTARLFRFCLPRELLEHAAGRARRDRQRQKCRRKLTLLDFRVRHFASILFRSRGVDSFLA